MEETEESVERHTTSATAIPASRDPDSTQPPKGSRNERHVHFAQQQSTQEDFYHETSESDGKSLDESEESMQQIY